MEQIKSSQKTLELMDLPNEILERIMQHVLLFEPGVEFSPLEDSMEHMKKYNLGLWQYRHVRDFRQVIRPRLALLCTCKKLHAQASRLYYSQNTFRFSGILGWLVLARFLDLIGPTNTQLLRQIAVIHPSIAQDQVWLSTHDLEHFYVRRLSPFGVTDLPDYAATYSNCEDGDNLRPVRGPLETLQGIMGLAKLDLLYYPTPVGYGEHKLSRAFPYADDISRILPSEAQGRLTITLINLCQRTSRKSACREDPPMKLAAIDPNAQVTPRTAGAHNFAVSVSQELKKHGWEVEDMEYDVYCGVWPLGSEQPDPESETSKYITDAEGWSNRECFEGSVEDQYDADRWYDGVQYFDCVKCWHDGGRDSCICEDGGTFLPDEWEALSDAIGNPGVAIDVDVEKHVVNWEMSYAAEDAEYMRNRDIGPGRGWPKMGHALSARMDALRVRDSETTVDQRE